jgi:hypothetical protein
VRCEATTKGGKRCTAWSLRGGRFCSMHVEGRARLLGQLGGKARVFDPSKLKVFGDARDAKGLKEVLARSISETRSGRMDPRAATAVSTLAATFLKAVDQGDLSDKIAKLEADVAAMKEGGGHVRKLGSR